MIGRHFVLAASLLALALAAGCSSGTSGSKAFESFQRTQTRLDEADRQVDKVLADMGQLQFSGNLNTMFKNYKASVDKLEQQGHDAQQRSVRMQENVDKYVEQWQKDMEKIDDPNIKANLAQRREAVKTHFDRVRAAAGEVRQAYDPFMKDNQNIVKTLSIDVSPGTVSSLKPTMDRATADGKVLKQKLGALQGELNKMQSGM